jgi:ornithine carbamoyltransferase
MRKISRAYLAHRTELIDDLFTEATKTMTWEELADKARLCRATVYRLGTYQTQVPQEMTIWKLARAVGMEVRVLTPREVLLCDTARRSRRRMKAA